MARWANTFADLSQGLLHSRMDGRHAGGGPGGAGRHLPGHARADRPSVLQQDRERVMKYPGTVLQLAITITYFCEAIQSIMLAQPFDTLRVVRPIEPQ
jgi:hypothetical protein